MAPVPHFFVIAFQFVCILNVNTQFVEFSTIEGKYKFLKTEKK